MYNNSHRWFLCLFLNVLFHRVLGFIGSTSKHDLFPSSISDRRIFSLASTLNDENGQKIDGNNEFDVTRPSSESSFGLTDEEFTSWLSAELSGAPGRLVYETTFDSAILAIVKWRQRFRGNPAVWKRIFKKDRVFKELIESAPILHSVQNFVNNNANRNADDDKITILDLCSGKGYLSMFLSEILPPEKVDKIILVDKAWAMCNHEVLPHHMNWEHIYGNIPDANHEFTPKQFLPESNATYFTTWPIPLHTSKQDLKQSCNQRQMKKHVFDRIEGPILILAVHLCGTLSLKAVDFFNNNENVKMFCLKPCCLPGMVHAKREDTFKIGRHSFPAADVCSNGSFNKKDWSGPPRWHLEKKFNLWSDHLYQGIDIDNDIDVDVDVDVDVDIDIDIDIDASSSLPSLYISSTTIWSKSYGNSDDDDDDNNNINGWLLLLLSL